MESIADISEWRLKLIFVAYGFDLGLLSEAEIDGLKIEIEYKTFDDLYTETNIRDPKFIEQFQQLFIDKLNSRRTPKSVREIVRKKIV